MSTASEASWKAARRQLSACTLQAGAWRGAGGVGACRARFDRTGPAATRCRGGLSRGLSSSNKVHWRSASRHGRNAAPQRSAHRGQDFGRLPSRCPAAQPSPAPTPPSRPSARRGQDSSAASPAVPSSPAAPPTPHQPIRSSSAPPTAARTPEPRRPRWPAAPPCRAPAAPWGCSRARRRRWRWWQRAGRLKRHWVWGCAVFRRPCQLAVWGAPRRRWRWRHRAGRLQSSGVGQVGGAWRGRCGGPAAGGAGGLVERDTPFPPPMHARRLPRSRAPLPCPAPAPRPAPERRTMSPRPWPGRRAKASRWARQRWGSWRSAGSASCSSLRSAGRRGVPAGRRSLLALLWAPDAAWPHTEDGGMQGHAAAPPTPARRCRAAGGKAAAASGPRTARRARQSPAASCPPPRCV